MFLEKNFTQCLLKILFKILKRKTIIASNNMQIKILKEVLLTMRLKNNIGGWKPRKYFDE